eukprot:gene5736-7920_t
MSGKIIILEIGTKLIRCGFAGESNPRCIMETGNLHSVSEDRLHSKLRSLIREIFMDSMQIVKPKNHSVLIVEKMCTRKILRDLLLTTLLHDYQVASVSMQPDLLMGIIGCGTSTGILLNIGERECEAIAFVQGRPLLQTYKVAAVGVYDARITFNKLLEEKLKKEIPIDVSNILFEQVSCITSPSAPEYVPSDLIVSPMQHIFNDSFVLTSDERQLAVKCLINGESEYDGCIDEKGGAAGVLLACINSCNVDIKTVVLNRVIICGGGAMIPGFIHAVCDHANQLALTDPYHKSTLENVFKKINNQKITPTNCPYLRSLLTWIGGSIFASIQSNAPRFVRVNELSEISFGAEKILKSPDWQSLNPADWVFYGPLVVEDKSKLVEKKPYKKHVPQPPMKPAEMRRKMKEAFMEIDADGSESIDQHEFIRAMKIFKINVSEDEVGRLYERFDEDGSNSIDYNEFLEIFGFADAIKEAKVSPELKKATDDLIARLRDDILKTLGSQSARLMREVFHEIDVDQSNSVDRKELMAAFKQLKIPITRKEIEMLYERFDGDRSNSIDYDEFLEVFGFKRDKKEKEIDEDLRKETDAILERLHRLLKKNLSALSRK